MKQIEKHAGSVINMFLFTTIKRPAAINPHPKDDISISCVFLHECPANLAV